MAFTQLIEIEGADGQALHDHVATWNAEQQGVAPGYLGARVLADTRRTGRYLIEVDFSSEQEAQQNNDRPETTAWAERLGQLGTVSDDGYRNLRQVCTTYDA